MKSLKVRFLGKWDRKMRLKMLELVLIKELLDWYLVTPSEGVPIDRNANTTSPRKLDRNGTVCKPIREKNLKFQMNSGFQTNSG